MFSNRSYNNNYLYSNRLISQFSNTAKTSYNSVSEKYNKTSSLEKLVLFLVFIIILYLIYNYFLKNQNETKVIDIHDASEKKIIDSGKLPAFSNTDYSISVWFYINDWNKSYGQKKYILGKYLKDGNDINPVPSITLDPFTNDLNVSVTYANPKPMYGGKKYSIHECTVNSVPLQKWCNVIMSVNNRLLDVYLDGKLRKTCPLEGVPMGNASSNMYLCGSPDDKDTGFSGFLSNMKIYTYAISPRKAYDIYSNGHSGSGIGSLANKYKLKMSIVEDNMEVNSLTLP